MEPLLKTERDREVKMSFRIVHPCGSPWQAVGHGRFATCGDLGKEVIGSFLACLILFPFVIGAAAFGLNIEVPNGSFEDVNTLAVGGVWPDADVDPESADFWQEPGPVNSELNAFPPQLIPPGFAPPQGATLDTGIFFNSPVSVDPSTGNQTTNPSFVTNADGQQLAYLFAQDDLDPSIAFIQHLPSALYQAGAEYTLRAAVGKSFFLPPIGGDRGDPVMALNLTYVDESGASHLVSQTEIEVSTVQNTTLIDFATSTPVTLVDPWQGRPIGMEIAPVDGSSGVWIIDHVRLTVIPEPSILTVLCLIGLAFCHRRPYQ